MPVGGLSTTPPEPLLLLLSSVSTPVITQLNQVVAVVHLASSVVDPISPQSPSGFPCSDRTRGDPQHPGCLGGGIEMPDLLHAEMAGRPS